MPQDINVYCDESCHLEHDHQTTMVLGAVWSPTEKSRQIADRIREIKSRHGMPKHFEAKWSKVSPAKVQLYLDLLDYFFDDDDLHFRALIVDDKSKLDHDRFGQDHDTFYYKMYFQLLSIILSPNDRYHIYLDVKDTRSAAKERKLREVLCNNLYDFDRRIVASLQSVRSHEVEQVQITDLLTGIVSYTNRNLASSPAKTLLVKRMQSRSGLRLTGTTLLRAEKVNLFKWHASEANA